MNNVNPNLKKDNEGMIFVGTILNVGIEGDLVSHSNIQY
jgi:hypothetical protein